MKILVSMQTTGDMEIRVSMAYAYFVQITHKGHKMDFNNALDAIKLHYQLDSDYKLALFLDISHGRMSHYRKSNKRPSDELILQVENLLDMQSGTLLLDIHSQHAKSPQVAKVYKAILARLKASNLSQTIVLSGVSIFPTMTGVLTSGGGYCILCQIADYEKSAPNNGVYLPFMAGFSQYSKNPDINAVIYAINSGSNNNYNLWKAS